jgi:hypothetical protein
LSGFSDASAGCSAALSEMWTRKEGRKPHAQFDFGDGFTLQDDHGAFCMAVAYPIKPEADAAAHLIREEWRQ